MVQSGLCVCVFNLLALEINVVRTSIQRKITRAFTTNVVAHKIYIFMRDTRTLIHSPHAQSENAGTQTACIANSMWLCKSSLITHEHTTHQILSLTLWLVLGRSLALAVATQCVNELRRDPTTPQRRRPERRARRRASEVIQPCIWHDNLCNIREWVVRCVVWHSNSRASARPHHAHKSNIIHSVRCRTPVEERQLLRLCDSNSSNNDSGRLPSSSSTSSNVPTPTAHRKCSQHACCVHTAERDSS